MLSYTVRVQKDRFILSCLMYLNGVLGLTKRELEVLSCIMDRGTEKIQAPSGEILYKVIRGAGKTVCPLLNISKYAYNNYVSCLRDKKAIMKENGITFVNRALYPMMECEGNLEIKMRVIANNESATV